MKYERHSLKQLTSSVLNFQNLLLASY